MRISYNWLKEFVNFELSPEQLSDLFNSLGHAVDGMTKRGGEWEGVVLGKVLTCERIPNTDHLSHCTVEYGAEAPASVVSGAPNVAVNQIVAFAKVGAVLKGGFKIGERKLKGVLSQGMICSEAELGTSNEHSGILVIYTEGEPVEFDYAYGTPLEELHYGKEDWIYELEITNNRPDCLSHAGIAQEIAAKLNLPLRLPNFEMNEIELKTSDHVKVRIDAPEKCHRYSAKLVQDVEVYPSPLWMRERLSSLGMRPINNIVDITNYLMMGFGHPLHAFDYKLVKDGEIVVRSAKEGEAITTLDNKTHKLRESDLLIADKEKGIALAGVMGGQNSEIQTDTKDVLIECALFQPQCIRYTSRDLGISSESSKRFERGMNAELIPQIIDYAAYLMYKYANGRICEGVVDEYPVKYSPKIVTLRPERVNSMLDLNIEPELMISYLTSLGCAHKGDFNFEPPYWRQDLDREIDLIEEIARLHGYDKIGERITSAVPLQYDYQKERERRLVSSIKSTLCGLGFREVITLTLVPSNDIEKVQTNQMPIKVINPLSDDMAHLRTNMMPSMLRAAVKSLNSGFKNVRIFEWGKCFWRNEAGDVTEQWRLSGVMIGNTKPDNWVDKTRQISYYDVKGTLENLFSGIKLQQYDFVDVENRSLILATSISFGSEIHQNRGHFGKITTEVAKRFGIDDEIWYFEIDGDRLLTYAGDQPKFKALPKFPTATRDIALLVGKEIRAEAVTKIVQEKALGILERVELFDVYTGDNISPDKKSIAFHLVFRSNERTLSDAEIDTVMKQFVNQAETELGAVLRSV